MPRLVRGFQVQDVFLNHNLNFKTMGKVSQGTANVTADVNVTVTFDESGLPVSATGQKELVEESGQTGEEPVNDLVILKATKDKYEAALTDAKTQYDAAVALAQSTLESDLVADNYVNGVYTAPAEAQS